MEVDIKLEDLDDGPLEVKVTKKRLRKQTSEADLSAPLDGSTPTDDADKKDADVKPAAKRAKKTTAAGETPTKRKKSNEAVEPSKRADHLQEFHSLTSDEIKKMQVNLLAWYDEHQRHMPWRKPSDNYKAKHGDKLVEGEYYDAETSKFEQVYGALVSELMLQQTQVATVRAYFEKWMKRFPTVESLAEASLEDVKAVWAGLGYYRRAKLIHDCAKAIVEKHGGKIPSSSVELEKLPGLGRYTAGAISSVVFGEAAPIVDGNVVRVLTRLRAIGEEAKSTRVVKALWDIAEAIVPEERAGDFNQAMMELGATLCTKANPNCDSCPLASQCAALAEVKSKSWKDDLKNWTRSGTVKREDGAEHDIEDLCTLCPTNAVQATAVTKYPVKGAKKEKKKLTTFISVVRWRNGEDGEWSFLLKKRPDGGLLGGFWEPPSLDLPQDDDGEEYAKVDESMASGFLLDTFGIDVSAFAAGSLSVDVKAGVASDNASVSLVRQFVGPYEHKFTHIDQSVLIEKLDITSNVRPELKSADGSEMKWVTNDDIANLAVSKVATVCFDRVKNPSTTTKKAPSSPKKKTAAANSDKKQPSILSMFSKKPSI